MSQRHDRIYFYRHADRVAAVTIGDRIEQRRLQVGIESQSELARRVPMQQSTLNGLINKPYRWSPFLPKIARELRTTVDYLAGETDDPDADAPPEPELTYDERQLVDAFGHLSPADQSALLQIARTMAEKTGPTVHSPKPGYRARLQTQGRRG